MFDLGYRILLHDKLRFLITVSGIAFAVTLVLTQVGLFRGILGAASVTVERADADFWITSRRTANVDFSGTFSQHYLPRVRSVPGVSRAENLIVWYVRMRLPNGASEGLMLYALGDPAGWNLPWDTVAGDPEDLRRGPYLFLDVSGHKRFGAFEAGERREVLGRRLRILGLTRDAESFTTTPVGFVDFRRLQELDPHNLRERTTYILVKLAPGADRESVRAELRRRLPHNDVHTREEWAAQSRRYWIVTTGIGLNMFLTAFLGCLVGVVIVAQTLYTSTLEHFREFAVVKALGGRNADLYGIVVDQAALAAVAGFAVGAALSYLCRPLMSGLGLKMLVDPPFVAAVFAGTLLLCVAASLVSFRKIATLDPVLVFRA
jgi:putative ABC transport system permease protein